MKRPNLNVCKGCELRSLHCHETCERYKELLAYYEFVRKEKIKENDFQDYSFKTARKKEFYGKRGI